MPTATPKKVSHLFDDLDVETDLDVPYSDTEYPPELIERWRRETEETKLKIASGELKIKSIREQFAEHGFFFD